MNPAAIGATGIAAVVFAVMALFQRSLYGSAICLLLVLLQVAAFFFLAGAQVLGFLQVLIYAGAIMVLLVVAVMSGPPRLERRWASLGIHPALAALGLTLPFIELGAAWRLGASLPAAPAASAPVLEQAMARLLFGPWALMTELIGVLVLVAALAAVPENG